MSFLTTAFNVILYQPLLNVLVLLYVYIPGHDFGIAVILLTLFIKFLFYPLGVKTVKSQKALSQIQPKLKEIQQKYKDDKEKQTKEMMAVYKSEKISPFSGCLPVLIQLPVLIALYRVFWHGLQPEQMTLLYSFVPNPGIINTMFLGIIDLANANIFVALLAGFFQFLQVKMMSPKIKSNKQSSNFSDQMQKQMMYFMPVLTVLILLRLPSAIGLYWVVSTVFTIIQQYVILGHNKNPEIKPE